MSRKYVTTRFYDDHWYTPVQFIYTASVHSNRLNEKFKGGTFYEVVEGNVYRRRHF